MQNHVTKIVFQNSKIWHFLGVNSEIYQCSKLTIIFIFGIFFHFILSLSERIFGIGFWSSLTRTIFMDTHHFQFHQFPIIYFRNLRTLESTHSKAVRMCIKSLLANLGKLIQKFFRNFSFPGCDTDRFLENPSSIFWNLNFRGMSWTDFRKIHPSIFSEYLFSFCTISGHETDRFLENSSIFGWFFRKSVCVTTQKSKIDCWMSFPEINLAHAPNLNKTE